MHKVVLDWQTAHANIGKPIELGERLCFGFHFYMADSREQGMKEAAKYYEENMKMFGELRLVRAITEEQIEIMRDPKRAPTAKLPRIEDAVKAGGFLCGNADDLIEHIKALEKKYRRGCASQADRAWPERAGGCQPRRPCRVRT